MKFIPDSAKLRFKNQRRQQRIAANPDRAEMGEAMHRLLTTPSTFDNSSVWATQKEIAEAIAPLIKKNQLAWQG